MIKIVIIDSGINEKFLEYIDFYYVVNQSNVVTKKELIGDTEDNHAGLCAYIIKEYAPYCEITNIKILGENHTAEIQKLKTALEWCLQQNVDIVSLSVGSREQQDAEALHPVVGELDKKGVVVVAAANNQNSITYPASFKEVIGVKCDLSNSLSEGEIWVDDKDIRCIDITVGNISNLPEVKHYNIGHYNSFIVPYVVAKIAHIIDKGKSCCTKEKVLYELRENQKEEMPTGFYTKSFPEFYVPNPIIVRLGGEDYHETLVKKAVEVFRKSGYMAIAFSDQDYMHNNCYYLSNDNAITKEEQYEYLKKVFDPDIIFLSEKVSVGQNEDTFLDITPNAISDKKQFGFDRGDETEAYEETQYLGTYGSYGISLTGKLTEELKPENVYVVGNISQEEKEAMIKQVMEQIKTMPQETSESNSIKIKAEEIENGDIVKLIEDLYA